MKRKKLINYESLRSTQTNTNSVCDVDIGQAVRLPRENVMKQLSKPEEFVGSQFELASDLTLLIKDIYGEIKKCESNYGVKSKGQTLPEMYVANFSDEQIWQQIEQHNIKQCKQISDLVSQCGQLETSIYHGDFNDKEKDNEDDEISGNGKSDEAEDRDIDPEDDDSDGDDSDDGLEDKNSDDDECSRVDGNSRTTTENNNLWSSAVDDKFFKLSEMENFLMSEDAKFMRTQDGVDEDGEVDMFEDIPEDGDEDDEEDLGGDDTDNLDLIGSDEEENVEYLPETKRKSPIKADELRFKHFFRPPSEMRSGGGGDKAGKSMLKPDYVQAREKYVKFNEDVTVDEYDQDQADGPVGADTSAGAKSPWMRRQEKLKQKILKLEEVNVSEKPWQLSGEAMADKRPENSLLEEHLDFDRTTRLPPVITEETTGTLEDLIRQRIKDQAWDDVERKVKVEEQPFQYRKRLALEEEKSKKSLNEIYEEEYLKKTTAQGEDGDEKEDENHADIRKMMDSLFYKLDALSNFHYTPRMPSTDVKIVNNLPAISMEEVAPVHMSDAMQLAPEEIKANSKGEVKGTAERDKTDKLRSRRQKKKGQKMKRVYREKKEKLVSKLKPGLGNKYSKERILEKLQKESSTTTIIKDDKKKVNPSLKSSRAFFDQLQNDAITHINAKKIKRKKKDNGEIKGDKFKL